ncbi:MAG: hypothetical protein NTV07_01350, partial [Candidatus Omnitrophica bacterium]|nr:hypothetical protein [Candidatus Omnitrophota bacterium]
RLKHLPKTDLAGLKSFLPEDLRTKFDRINIAGSGEGEIKVYKRFKEPTPLAVSGRIKIKGASFNSPDMPEGPEKIMGDVIFENEAIYFSRASFVYGKKSYLVDAKIEDFKTPDIKMRLESKDFLIDARLKLFPESIHILRASGNYLNSPFNISGTVSDIKNAQVSLKGNIKLDLVNLRTLLPGISEPLTRFGIKGICDLEFDLKGPWKEFRNWDAVVKGKSERINIWDLKFDSVKLDLRIKQNALLLNELSAKPYGGALFSNMEIDLTQPNPPYTANLVLDGVDLNKLIADTDLKGRTMSGTAALKTTLRGYGKNTDTMKGEGSVLIKGSYLWEMPLLKGLGDLLFLPNLSSIVFEEVSGNFIITNKTITTSNLGFHSKGISLLAEGGVNFDGNLDLMVTTSVSEDFVKDTSEFQRLAGLLFAQAGQFLGNIKINGTIKKPEYKFVPFALDKVLPDKFKDLLGGFF